MAFIPRYERLGREECNMTDKLDTDIMVDSFKSLTDVMRDLEGKYPNDPRAMLTGAIHALYTSVMMKAPSPIIAMSFLLDELTRFADSLDSDNADKWVVDVIGDDDETMH